MISYVVSWVVPLPSNSHHQDCYIFSRGSLINLHLPLLLGGGSTQVISSFPPPQPQRFPIASCSVSFKLIQNFIELPMAVVRGSLTKKGKLHVSDQCDLQIVRCEMHLSVSYTKSIEMHYFEADLRPSLLLAFLSPLVFPQLAAPPS